MAGPVGLAAEPHLGAPPMQRSAYGSAAPPHAAAPSWDDFEADPFASPQYQQLYERQLYERQLYEQQLYERQLYERQMYERQLFEQQQMLQMQQHQQRWEQHALRGSAGGGLATFDDAAEPEHAVATLGHAMQRLRHDDALFPPAGLPPARHASRAMDGSWTPLL